MLFVIPVGSCTSQCVTPPHGHELVFNILDCHGSYRRSENIDVKNSLRKKCSS